MKPTIQKTIAIEWRGDRPKGQVRVAEGKLLGMTVSRGNGSVESGFRFAAAADATFRIEVSIEGTDQRYGPSPTIVSVLAGGPSFSFFLRDVNPHFPMLIPEYGVLVTTAADQRSFTEVEDAILKRGSRTRLQQIESEPEESFESAAGYARLMTCPTWLGVSRDMRIFAVGERLDWIQPRFHYVDVSLPESNDKPFRYEFLMGRGWGIQDKIERRLDGGSLPILRGTVEDGEVTYQLTAFVTLEMTALTPQTLKGTDFLVADGHARGHMFTPEQQRRFESLLPGEMQRNEETVLCMSLSAAINTSAVPRYAYFRSLWPNLGSAAWAVRRSGCLMAGRDSVCSPVAACTRSQS